MVSQQRIEAPAGGRVLRRQLEQQRQQQQEQRSPYRGAGRELPEKQQQARRPTPAVPPHDGRGADQ